MTSCHREVKLGGMVPSAQEMSRKSFAQMRIARRTMGQARECDLDSPGEIRQTLPHFKFSSTKEGHMTIYHSEAKPQGWRALVVFDDRPECLLYVGRSSTQVRANF